MDAAQVTLVQTTFSKVAPAAPQVAAAFYKRLFEIDPNLRAMFPEDLTEQGNKLMMMLRTVVAGLDAPATILPAAEALGKRHVQYGVKPEHYGAVGSALLDTLRSGLGREFTPDVEGAWTAAYTLLSQVMIKAAY